MRNPGLFDYRLFLRTKGIIGIVNTEYSHLEVVGHQESLSVFTQRLKDVFSSCLDKYMESDTKALFLGILFGDKSLIDEISTKLFSVTGVPISFLYPGSMSVSYIFISVDYSETGEAMRAPSVSSDCCYSMSHWRIFRLRWCVPQL